MINLKTYAYLWSKKEGTFSNKELVKEKGGVFLVESTAAETIKIRTYFFDAEIRNVCPIKIELNQNTIEKVAGRISENHQNIVGAQRPQHLVMAVSGLFISNKNGDIMFLIDQDPTRTIKSEHNIVSKIIEEILENIRKSKNAVAALLEEYRQEQAQFAKAIEKRNKREKLLKSINKKAIEEKIITQLKNEITKEMAIRLTNYIRLFAGEKNCFEKAIRHILDDFYIWDLKSLLNKKKASQAIAA